MNGLQDTDQGLENTNQGLEIASSAKGEFAMTTWILRFLVGCFWLCGHR